ncbi:MAG: preprotein translocase subunit SecA, partial [Gammaproteobacteria bacterium]|nr:preprotein translocase subunit SecA [Gammaproteobacteria bacterium]
MSIFNKIFGSSNSRKIKKLQKVVDRINGLEPSLEALSDDELKAKTEEFKQRFDSGESMEALLPEAFAVVREAGKRTLQMRHFDVQMIGGIVLHEGSISEMR